MTQLYFQNEYNLLRQNQKQSMDGNVFYSQDYKSVKEVPEHRLQHRNMQQHNEDGSESYKEVMMAPNNIEYFYAAEETSERIWRIDNFMNRVY